MKALKIENSKIEKTDFNHIDKLTYDVCLENDELGFKVGTTREQFNIATYDGIESIHSIFSKLINDVKRADNEEFVQEYKNEFIVLKNDKSLSNIANQIKIEPIYEDIYGTMSEGNLIDSDLESKAQFKARFVQKIDGLFWYEILYVIEKN